MTAIETQSQDAPVAALKTAILVGNPNVGKSAIFFALTGRYVTVSNFPGTTIELTRGRCSGGRGEGFELIDTPGTTRLSAGSDDERVTCELLRSAGAEGTAAVVVSDALNLRRGLAIALEVGALGLPLLLVINMMDEAAARGLQIDVARLSRLLGVPVIPTVATRGEGVGALRAAIQDARPLGEWALPRGGEADGQARWLARADEIRGQVVREGARPRGRLAAAFGRAAVHPWLGWPIAAVVLYLSYLVVGKLGAGVAVDFLQNTVFGASDGAGLVGRLARLSAGLGAPQLLQDLLFGPYGAVSMAVTYALALILPIVGFFFVVFGFLEDTGYLPRLAVVTNRAFSRIGLNGKAVLPMILGLGCDTMATLSTRILATRRERLIVALLLAIAVPCSAQLAVVFGLFAVAGGPRLLAAWLGVLLVVFAAAGWLAGKLIPGDASDFIIELPPIRRPRAANIARKTLARIEWYLKEAVPLFVVGTLVLFVLDRLNALGAISRAMEPLVTGLLGLPADCATAFVVGFLRRDYGAVYLLDAARGGSLTQSQVLVAAVTITLFLPCIATWFMLVREFGMKIASATAALVVVLAFGVGALMHLAIGG
ncbi:MAG TPA: ferrous iron transporter B [Planctomycetota bacterium]|nr:ferrous iron transporter B [Planctomycetota bacterium]